MSGTIPVELTDREITALRLIFRLAVSDAHTATFLTEQDREALRSARVKLNEASCRTEGQ